MPVIYLTGAPATGKSTLTRNLGLAFPGLVPFVYSERLRDFLSRKANGPNVDEAEIRRLSASIVSPQDIQDLDSELIELVRSIRGSRSVLIDSHAVTKESYGFRVTAFSTETLMRLDPDVIVCLYASSETILARIHADARGRPTVTAEEASMHTQLQATLAIQYGTILGRPVYMIDSAVSERDLVSIVAARTKLGDLPG